MARSALSTSQSISFAKTSASLSAQGGKPSFMENRNSNAFFSSDVYSPIKPSIHYAVGAGNGDEAGHGDLHKKGAMTIDANMMKKNQSNFRRRVNESSKQTKAIPAKAPNPQANHVCITSLLPQLPLDAGPPGS